MRPFSQKPMWWPKRKAPKLFDEPKTYHLPTSGDLTMQPNVERACEVYWGAAYPGDNPAWMSWEEITNADRLHVRMGVAAVLHWTQQQPRFVDDDATTSRIYSQYRLSDHADEGQTQQQEKQ